MNPKRNIAIFIRSLETGGAEKYSLRLAKALTETHHVHLIVVGKRIQTIDPNYLSFIQQEGFSVTQLSGNLFQKFLACRRILIQEEIEITFSHLPSDTLFSFLAGLWSGVRYQFGGIQNSRFPFLKRAILKLIHNYFLEASISNSQAGKDYLAQYGFKADTICVIPNCIDIRSPQIVRSPSSKVQILTVARFVDQKDYETALQAISLVRKFLPEDILLQYHIVGYGILETQIRAWVHAYDLEEMVRITVRPPNLNQQFQEADIYLCTSIFEGLSNSLMEAMHFSLPIVSTDVGDNALLIREEENGFVLQTHQPEEIADKLLSLICNYEQRIEYGKSSYTHLEETYSYESFQHTFLQLVGELS
ncbi:MAG: glycosyltransferase family 4 protein [Bacteroidota bacterium]